MSFEVITVEAGRVLTFYGYNLPSVPPGSALAAAAAVRAGETWLMMQAVLLGSSYQENAFPLNRMAGTSSKCPMETQGCVILFLSSQAVWSRDKRTS